MIIGVIGTRGSGKGEVCEFLKSKGFIHFSTSDEVRREVRSMGMEVKRENLQRIAGEMRKEFGGTIFTKRCIERMEDGKNYVIDAMRHPDEINELRKHRDFFLVSIDAPQRLRFERMHARENQRGERDATTWERFLELDEIDNASIDPAGQQNFLCMKMADFNIYNDCDIGTFSERIKDVMEKIAKTQGRDFRSP